MPKIAAALLATTTVVSAAIAIAGSAYAADAVRPIQIVPSPALPAAPRAYVSLFGGVAFANDPSGTYTDEDFDAPTRQGYLFGGALGGNITPNLRAEVEVSYAHHDLTGTLHVDNVPPATDSGNVSTLYALGNLWLDLHPGGHITPYVGGGAGIAVLMPDITNIFDSGTDYQFTKTTYAPAAQIGVGLRISHGPNVTLDIGYRLKAVFNATLHPTGNTNDTPVNAVTYVDQTVQAGIAWNW